MTLRYLWSKLSAARWSDAWEERFRGVHDTGLVISGLPGRATIRVEVYCRRRSEADRIQREFGGSVKEIKKQNWAAAASAGLRPVKVRDRLVIVHDDAARREVERDWPGRALLQIPGELAFGTGDHATTATCLRVLADLSRKQPEPWNFLDIGCGTGILALAATRLGATDAGGFDYDPAAVRIARRNANLNQLRRVKFRQDDLLEWEPERTWTVVGANVFYDVLTVSFAKLFRAVVPDGWLIVSGILRTQAAGCLTAARKAGLVVAESITRGKWVTIVARRKA